MRDAIAGIRAGVASRRGYSQLCEQVSGAPGRGPGRRRRRRHRRAPHDARPAAALPRGGEPQVARVGHRRPHGFIRAGAELIETNTFGANRRKLSAQFLDDQLEQIVERGVKLAREAREVSGAPVLIGGSIGPLGDLEHTTGAEDAFAVFHEQARLLEGRGVDLFLVETFYDLDELETAIKAVQDVSSLPIVAQLTFDEDAQTLAGVHAPRRGRAADGARRGRDRSQLRARPTGCAGGAGRDERAPRTGSRSRPSRTSACPRGRAAAWSTRTRPPTTSPSSPLRRGASAPA